MLRNFLIVTIVSATAIGCSSKPVHTCPLSEDGYTCSSVSNAYGAAKAPSGHKDTVFDPIPEKGVNKKSKKVPLGDASSNSKFFQEFEAAGDRGKPVYTPPTPHRLWKAPAYFTDGILSGGEYLYYTTPGRWNFGTLQTPGDISDAVAPVSPEALGFRVLPSAPGSLDTDNTDTDVHHGIVQPEQRMTPLAR